MQATRRRFGVAGPALAIPPMRVLWGVQYLRAVAALSVLVFHAVIDAGAHNALGAGGVDIFFLISGFLMFELAARAPAPGRFMLDRIRRIVPSYWLVTLIVAGIQLAGGTKNGLDLAHLAKSMMFLPDLDEVRQKTYPTLIVGWTLNYEMFFYALVAGLLFVKEPLRIVVLCYIFATLLLAGALLRGQSVALDFYSDPIILEFLFGASISVAWRADALPRRGWPMVIAGLALLIMPQIAALPRFVSYGLPATLILLGVLSEEACRPVPRVAVLKLLGDVSYSLYLWHLFAVALSLRVFGGSAWSIPAGIAGGTALGVAFYWLIEKPSLALLKPRSTPRRPMPVRIP